MILEKTTERNHNTDVLGLTPGADDAATCAIKKHELFRIILDGMYHTILQIYSRGNMFEADDIKRPIKKTCIRKSVPVKGLTKDETGILCRQ